eukprot:gnl/TRDRNA2_/TRDRNA2_168495_c1_seq1.p1 gnl/TRDRNA2_/TRDRNA2_168495_c1~~gnl/TRDRNA2_/TRDRNA2_168495_c1_seq1.p1  ORF type:complete len:222 (+),score=49.33 gnl/TRDRNA2_/TRDRNA2_168495_c1_seq1:147-812(+)
MQAALARTAEDFELSAEVVWHPYFLDVTTPASGPLTKRESYHKKFGMDDHKLARMEKKMKEVFEAEGLTYTLDGPMHSSIDSHRLAAWTFTKYGSEVQDRLVEVLFRQFFSEGRSPADGETLVSAAVEVGIGAEDAKAFLESGAGRQNVLESAHKLMSSPNVTGVPHYFVSVQVGGEDGHVDQRPQVYGIPGAQDTDTFYLSLRQLIGKAQKQQVEATSKL